MAPLFNSPMEYQMGKGQPGNGSEGVQESVACWTCSLVERHTVTVLCIPWPHWPHRASLWGLLAAGVKQSLNHSTGAIFMQKCHERNKLSLKSHQNTVEEPLQVWVDACMHEPSVRTEQQVENQQVISTDSEPFHCQEERAAGHVVWYLQILAQAQQRHINLLYINSVLLF